MLYHGLAASEGSGNSGYTTQRNGEQGINDSLACYQGRCGCQLLLIGSLLTDRPFLHHGQWHTLTIGRLDLGHRIHHGKVTGLYALNNTVNSIGHHDTVLENLIFLDGTDNVSGRHRIPHLYNGRKGPFLFPVQRGNLYSAGDIVPRGRPHGV